MLYNPYEFHVGTWFLLKAINSIQVEFCFRDRLWHKEPRFWGDPSIVAGCDQLDPDEVSRKSMW